MGEGIGEVIDCSKFGSLRKILQVTCFVRQFLLNLEASERGVRDYKEVCRWQRWKKVRCCG